MKHIYRLMVLWLMASLQFLYAQEAGVRIHSHNDYAQAIPFWTAYDNGLNSIEVDIVLKDSSLFVTHGEKIIPDRQLENLYLQPLQKALDLELGEGQELQLLVDIKSEAYTTLDALISVLEKYSDLIQNKNIRFVISGNRPKVGDYTNYPDYIHFDYQSLEDIGDAAAWEKVALISLNFRNFSPWNGKGRLTHEDYKTVKDVIDKAHSFNKPFRFWATPDSKTAWKAFRDLGVDYINTDMPYESARYLTSLDHRLHSNLIQFEIYRPSFRWDGKDMAVKNIILLVGDGNGLSQISAAVLGNGGELTLTQLKSIGFLKTQSADDFTTDSAAAGTALATGAKTNNRAIGMDSLGRELTNITELLAKEKFATGIITTDKITGATPASFYAHRKDRDESKGIAADLLGSRLNLFIGGGASDFGDWGSSGFNILQELEEIGSSKAGRVGYFLAEGSVPAVMHGRDDVLARATAEGLEFLSAIKKPFFLMVEGAQIDSYGHENNIAGIVSEGIDFDKAVAEAIKFADSHKGTLVIITADHETGGVSLPQGRLSDKMVEGDFTTDDHTATMVPIFAYGPRSGEFRGVYENNEVFAKILKVLGLDGL